MSNDTIQSMPPVILPELDTTRAPASVQNSDAAAAENDSANSNQSTLSIAGNFVADGDRPDIRDAIDMENSWDSPTSPLISGIPYHYNLASRSPPLSYYPEPYPYPARMSSISPSSFVPYPYNYATPGGGSLYHFAIPDNYGFVDPEQLFDPIDPYAIIAFDSERANFQSKINHVIDQSLRQMYLHFLLRVPKMYFMRVSRVFGDAKLSKQDMKRLTKQQKSARLDKFNYDWKEFVHGMVKEWKTLNVVSALLLSAVLTMLQIQDAASNPITRTGILFSLVCSLMSLCYGCIYVIRFGSMLNIHKGAGFAKDIKRKQPSLWWNVYVLLAMPAFWLGCAMLFFCASILSYVWTSESLEAKPLSRAARIAPRVAVTATFALGALYFVLALFKLQNYRVHHTNDTDKEKNSPHPIMSSRPVSSAYSNDHTQNVEGREEQPNSSTSSTSSNSPDQPVHNVHVPLQQPSFERPYLSSSYTQFIREWSTTHVPRRPASEPSMPSFIAQPQPPSYINSLPYYTLQNPAAAVYYSDQPSVFPSPYPHRRSVSFTAPVVILPPSSSSPPAVTAPLRVEESLYLGRRVRFDIPVTVADSRSSHADANGSSPSQTPNAPSSLLTWTEENSLGLYEEQPPEALIPINEPEALQPESSEV